MRVLLMSELDQIHDLAARNQIAIGPHARERMEQRKIRFNDIRQALLTATVAEPQPDERWKCVGQDLDDEPTTIIVKIETRLLIITVY
jgi:hypothetical protein